MGALDRSDQAAAICREFAGEPYTWYFFFSDSNSFIYWVARRARFRWQGASLAERPWPVLDETMSSNSDRTLNRIAAVGLLVGATFGLAGTLVPSPHVQASLRAIDSVALVVATSLLALFGS